MPRDSSATFMRALRPKPSPAVLLLAGSRRLRGLPVLVHEASRRVWGLRLRRTGQELAISPPPVLPSPMQKRQRPDCIFWSSIPSQCTPVYASPHTSRCAAQNSGPSGSLLLSRRTLPFPASCRFIPAHRIGDYVSMRTQSFAKDTKTNLYSERRAASGSTRTARRAGR